MPSIASLMPLVSEWPLALPFSAGVACAAAALVVGRRIARRPTAEPQPLPIERVHKKDAPSWVPGNAPRPPVSERRQTPRHDARKVRVEVRRANGCERVGEAVVMDRSNGGLRLLAGFCLPLSSQVQIRPVDVGDSLPWVPVEVRNCRHRRLRGWEMGCLFLRPPPWHVGMHLG